MSPILKQMSLRDIWKRFRLTRSGDLNFRIRGASQLEFVPFCDCFYCPQIESSIAIELKLMRSAPGCRVR